MDLPLQPYPNIFLKPSKSNSSIGGSKISQELHSTCVTETCRLSSQQVEYRATRPDGEIEVTDNTQHFGADAENSADTCT